MLPIYIRLVRGFIYFQIDLIKLVSFKLKVLGIIGTIKECNLQSSVRNNDFDLFKGIR